MKQFLTISLALLISVASFAQKKELKIAKKAIDAQQFSNAIAALTNAQPLIDGAKDKLKAQYYYYLGQANYANGTTPANFTKAYEALNTLVGMNGKFVAEGKAMQEQIKQYYYSKANETYKKAAEFANAGEEEKAKPLYLESANEYLQGYKYSGEKDHQALYQASNYFFYGESFANAIASAESLLKTGYTGEATYYSVVNVASEQRETCASEEDMNKRAKSPIYSDPKVDKVPSQLKHIYKLISLSYSKLGNNDKALEAIASAREQDPNDYGIIVSEANIYYGMGNNEMFQQKLEEAVKINPNEPSLFYNIGVMKMQQGDAVGAMQSYEKAIALNPEYAEAYNNIGAIVLDKAKPIVEEMNNTTNFKKYGELQKKQEAVLREALPYFEKAYQYNKSELSVVQNLMGIYSNLEMEAKEAEMKAAYDLLK